MSFNIPVFLKDTNSMEDKLKALKAKTPYDREGIHKLEMGIEGENQVAYHLKKSNIGMYILRDVYLSVDDMNSQIDFVVITSHHCYFVESKNYDTDKIVVDENRNFEINIKNRGRNKRKGIKSPLSQVDDQLNVLKRICLKNEERSKQLFRNTRFNDYFKTLVVFANSENKLEMKKAPSDIKYRILKVDNLIRQIEYDNEHFTGNKLSQNEMKDIADFILSNHVEPKVDVAPPRIEYIIVEEGRNIFKVLKAGLIAIIAGVILISIFSSYYTNYYKRNNSSTNSGSNTAGTRNKSNSKTTSLTPVQLDALNKLKEAYNNSVANGFDVIHGNTCKTVSSIFGDKGFPCGQYPLQVNYKSDNEITIYSNWNCYSLTIDNNSVTSSNIENLMIKGNESCKGIPIGYANIDESNDYCKKIGGFEKVKELAMYTKLNKKSPYDYYTSNHISERGGSTNLYSTYFTVVNQYMCGITSEAGGGGCGFVGKEESDKMCEYYYYIMK